MSDRLPFFTRFAPYLWAVLAVLTFTFAARHAVRGDLALFFVEAFFCILWTVWACQAVRRRQRWHEEQLEAAERAAAFRLHRYRPGGRR